MNDDERIKLIQDVFEPKPGENILLIVDIPHGKIEDNEKWSDRRKMAKEWYETFKKMGEESNFTTNFFEYKATGMHNKILTKEIIDEVKKSNLFIAMTEYSSTSTLLPLCRKKGSTIRGASMPTVEKRMENTAFKANYKEVKKYAIAIEKLLNNALGAEIKFSTGDSLYMDLRNRKAGADIGECKKYGQAINFPSGEACVAPYEATKDEIKEFGQSKTKGFLPAKYENELVKFLIKENRIVDVIGKGENAEKMRKFFKENITRKNIAELGIGCNPKAVVTGNILEDEKVGLHIAYGMSVHIGGKIKSDMHQDIVYAKDCPVEGKTVTLFNKDGSKTDIIKDAMLQYNLLK